MSIIKQFIDLFINSDANDEIQILKDENSRLCEEQHLLLIRVENDIEKINKLIEENTKWKAEFCGEVDKRAEITQKYLELLEHQNKEKILTEKLYEKIEQNAKFGFAYVTKKEIENVVRELEGKV